MLDTIKRWGGVLVRPRATFAAFDANPGDPKTAAGRWDGWLLTALFVLGSQTPRLVETVAKYQAFDSALILVNGLALALLAPILAGLLVEGLLGARHRPYRNLPLVPLVFVATLGNLLRQQGVPLPGLIYMPEMIGTAWAVGLAIWARQVLPGEGGSSGDSKASSKPARKSAQATVEKPTQAAEELEHD